MRAVQLLARRRLLCSTPASSRWHVAIIGSGPSAFYTADHLLKQDPNVTVDLFEQLPVPFGLVRYGVAPDHQEVKLVTKRFHEIASSERCSLLANVCVGQPGRGSVSATSAAHLPLELLREQYNAVVLAYGADADRKLGVPGENIHGVHSARQFVEWYNGHPAALTSEFDLRRCETAVVIGNGNVALDCARMLASTPEQLVGDTDVAEHAAAVLADSAVRQVVLLGRRGVAQAAFTIKELRELSKRAGATMNISAPPDAFNAAVVEYASAERPRKRLMDLMQKLSEPTPTPDPPPPPPPSEPRAVRLQFQRSPLAFLGGGTEGDGEGRDALRAILVGRTKLEGPPSASQRANLIEGSEYELPCTLALRAVGYRSSPIDGAPFDAARGVVPSTGGRVDGEAALYVSGWLRRGPTGVILTNVNDAAETAAALLEDRAAGKLDAGGDGGEAVRAELVSQGAPLVDFGAWEAIDRHETERGKAANKVREKVVSIDEMLSLAAQSREA